MLELVLTFTVLYIRLMVTIQILINICEIDAGKWQFKFGIKKLCGSLLGTINLLGNQTEFCTITK